MIAFLKGKATHLEPTFVILEVNGVGYHVNISLQTYSEIKGLNEIFLFTHLNVREDAHVLYGFSSAHEKKLFQNLIAVNGIGPGTAIVMLSYLSPGELSEAILREDVAAIQAVKGIGTKTAQRVIIELKGKIRKDGLAQQASSISGASHNTLRTEALSALVTLGIPKSSAEKSVDAVLTKSGNTITLENLVKQALKNN